MTWMDARVAEDEGMDEFWEVFCIHLEQVAESYGSSPYAREHKLIAATKRIENCVHVIRSSAGMNKPEISIDVCFDRSGRRVFSRRKGMELKTLRIGLEPNRETVCLLDAAGAPLTDDQASRFFLEKFLFPDK